MLGGGDVLSNNSPSDDILGEFSSHKTGDVAVHASCLPSAQCANSNRQVVTELHASVHSHLGACL